MSEPVEPPEAADLVVRKHDGVPVLELPESLAFDALRDRLDERLPALIEGLAGDGIRLDLGARGLDLFDLRRLVHHLKDEHDLDVTGLYATAEALHRFGERELKLKLFLKEPCPPDVLTAPQPTDNVDPADDPSPPLALDPDQLRTAQVVVPTPEDDDDVEETEVVDATPAGRRTLHVKRTVRSGNSVQFDGDVTVFGDVNPGAQVTASGSILVMGALKGVAHAGATGDEDAFILGLTLQPTQLRIARRIAIAPDDNSGGPEIAIVRDGRIVIEPYRSRLPR